MPGRRRWPWSCKARLSHGLGQCLFKPSLYFADALARRFPSAPAATQGQGIHPPANVTEVAIPGFAWASYSIGACACALATVGLRAPLLLQSLLSFC
jgi:hypothetical protein